jgi:signal peptidase I
MNHNCIYGPWNSHVIRRLVEGVVFLILAGLAVRTWYVEGLLVPYRVASGSMAPTLLGPHFDLVCRDCGCPLACDSFTPPRGRRAVCPNCGYREDWPDPDWALAGDRLLVDKSTFRLRPPQRWEVVAVREPEHAAQVAIKRVVGLPGESVEIRDGDLYIDGRIQRKPLARQRATAVPVYDASHPPQLSRCLPPRWSGDGSANPWSQSEGRFLHAAGSTRGPIDWLRYRHWRRIPGGREGGQVQFAPITNECYYNASLERPEGTVRSVRDLLLAFRLVRTCGRGRLYVAIADGRKEFQVEIDPNRASYVILENGHPLTGAGGSPLPLAVDGRQIEVWLADARLVFLMDGRPVFVRCYEPAIAAQAPPSKPLAIGASGLGVEISDLRVYRDVDYSRPARIHARWGYNKPVKLGKDEYFILGDNSEVSIDSRSWIDGPAVPASLLVGKPLLVHFPCRGIMIGGRHFQVPDILRIRYIR